MSKPKLRHILLSCLHRAFDGAPDALDELARQDPDRVREFLALPKTKTIFAGSLFQEACRRQPLLLVGLVRLGWPVDAAMTPTMGPLGMAIELGSIEAVKELLSLGADPNAKVEGVPPLYHCGNTSGANTDEEMSLLHERAAHISQLLCEHGADPDGGDSIAKPLSAMATRGLTEAALVLISWGASRQIGDTTVDRIARQCAQDEFAQQVLAAFELRALETGTAQASRKVRVGTRL